MSKHNIANLERVAAAAKNSHSTLATIKASAEVVDFYLANTPDTAQAILRALREARAALLKYKSIGAYDVETDAFNKFEAREALAKLSSEFEGWGDE